MKTTAVNKKARRRQAFKQQKKKKKIKNVKMSEHRQTSKV